jgi:hypothetical protein
MKKIILFFIVISLLSCKKENSTNSNGTFNLVLANGQKLSANYKGAYFVNTPPEVGFQDVGRAIFNAAFNIDSEVYIEVWPDNTVGGPKGIQINKKYLTGNSSSMRNVLEIDCIVNGKDLIFDYAEILFTKYSVPGQVEGTYLGKKNNSTVFTGSFNLTTK